MQRIFLGIVFLGVTRVAFGLMVALDRLIGGYGRAGAKFLAKANCDLERSGLELIPYTSPAEGSPIGVGG